MSDTGSGPPAGNNSARYARPVTDTPRFAIVEHPDAAAHVGPDGHPERPERLAAVGEAIDPFRTRLRVLTAREASDDEILRIHDRAHLDGIVGAVEAVDGRPGQVDPDTYVTSDSLRIARLAAGATIDLCQAVARGDVASGLAAVRPPGHHAEADRPMGFCLFNNIAIAARALQAEAGVEKVMILDWDVHHGNGTQHAFENDPSVLFLSTHQYPYYPGTGDFGELGFGRGEGATVNVPMPAGCGDAEYLGVLQHIVEPVARAFAPDVILVSAGFDAHRDDPLAAMAISATGYLAMATFVRALAEDLCDGRLAYVLEGGYALSGLREGVSGCLVSGVVPNAAAPPPEVPLADGSVLAHLVEQVALVHHGRGHGA